MTYTCINEVTVFGIVFASSQLLNAKVGQIYSNFNTRNPKTLKVGYVSFNNTLTLGTIH